MVNSTLYLIQCAGKSLNFKAFGPAVPIFSALPLLVLLFAAYDVQNALASHNLAVSADLFN
jgi:hypothetical protein